MKTRQILIFIPLFFSLIVFAQEEESTTYLKKKSEAKVRVFFSAGAILNLSSTNLFNHLDISPGTSLEFIVGKEDFVGIGLIYNNRKIEIANHKIFGLDLNDGNLTDFGIYFYYQERVFPRFLTQLNIGIVSSRIKLEESDNEFRLDYSPVFVGGKLFFSIDKLNIFQLYAAPNFYFYRSDVIDAPKSQEDFLTKSVNFRLSLGIQITI